MCYLTYTNTTGSLGRGSLKMRDRKMRDWKMRHLTAVVENAELENAWNDIVWNTVYSLCLLCPSGCGHWVRLKRGCSCTHAALRRRVQVAHPNLYTFLGHLQRATADGETDIARLNRGMSIRRSKKRTNLINETRIKACIFPLRQRRVHTRAVSARSESQCGRTRCPWRWYRRFRRRGRRQSPQRQRPASVRCQWTAVAGLMRGVSGAAARHTTCLCAVRVPAFLCFLRRSAWVTSSRLPNAALSSAWSCVCTSGSEMLLMLTMYCLWTICTVFLSLRFAFFFSIFILITLMITLTTCVCSLVLRQTK